MAESLQLVAKQTGASGNSECVGKRQSVHSVLVEQELRKGQED